MSFTGLLRHSVELHRRVAVLDAGEPTYTELGQPITAIEVVGTLRCRIEPLSAREVALLSQAGPVVADHRLYFTRAADVHEPDQLVATDGRVFEVQKIDDLGGAGRYLEVAARLIVSEDVPAPSPS